MASKLFATLLASISTMALMFSPTFGQITTSTPCTSSMITNFTPCVNFVANGTLNTTTATTPPPACCTSLASLMGSGKDCFCQIVNGNVPFQIPINQTLVVSLPRACNMPGVPLQCKALGAPVPALGPTVNGLSPGPTPDIAPPPSSIAPAGTEPQSPILAPEAETTTTETPPSPATTGGSPAGNTGSRAGLTPSAANPSFGVSPPLLLVAVIGAIAVKNY